MLNLDFVCKKDRLRLQQAANRHFFSKKTLNVLRFENATVAPGWAGGVWLENQTHLPQTWIHWRCDKPQKNPPESLRWWLDERQKTPPEIAQTSDESVVFVGLFSAVWGHEITDHLKHFWFYFDKRFAHLTNLPFVFAMLWENKMPSDNFFQLLNTIGIPKEKLRFISRPTQFKEIYIPDECFFYDPKECACRYTQEYANFFNKIKYPPPPPESMNKIYFSRLSFSKQKNQKDFNEESLEQFFLKQCFKIIHPETLPLLEQIAYLKNAKVFATTDGSIAHNLLFCNDGIQTIICRKSHHFAIHQMPLNYLKKAQVIYIDCGFSPRENFKKEWWTGPFFLYVNNDLRRFFKLPWQAFPFLQFFKFLFQWKRKWFSWEYLKNKYLRFK